MTHNTPQHCQCGHPTLEHYVGLCMACPCIEYQRCTCHTQHPPRERNPMRKSELLDAVHHRLADPNRWCQHTSARDTRGDFTPPENDAAVAWCLSGALRRELHDHDGYNTASVTQMMAVQRALENEFANQFPNLTVHAGDLWPQPIELYNDNSQMTHPQLLAVLEKTRLALTEKGE